jgi:predicted  nucleic acid-binding Zn-ribbon protein
MDKEILEILKSMKIDMSSMKTDITSMKTDITSMKTDITSIQQDMTSIKATQGEHTQILRALEHKTDVISAEQENLKHELAEVKGEVKGIRKDLFNVELITASNWSDIVKLKAVK